MSWKVAEAKQRFSQVIRAAAREPQPILNRDRLVGAVIGPEDLERLRRLREREERSLGTLFADLREICAEESFELEAPARVDRVNPFADGDDRDDAS